jgi:hypothetical protein
MDSTTPVLSTVGKDSRAHPPPITPSGRSWGPPSIIASLAHAAGSISAYAISRRRIAIGFLISV